MLMTANQNQVKGVLTAINVSEGGIPKCPVPKVEVTASGLVGDGHAHRKHLKPSRGVSLLDAEVIEGLRRDGYPVGPGVLGENLTLANLNAQGLDAGTRLQFEGGVEIELTELRKPCFVLDAVDARLKVRTVGQLGWLAQVSRPGWLTAGESVVVTGIAPASAPSATNSD